MGDAMLSVERFFVMLVIVRRQRTIIEQSFFFVAATIRGGYKRVGSDGGDVAAPIDDRREGGLRDGRECGRPVSRNAKYNMLAFRGRRRHREGAASGGSGKAVNQGGAIGRTATRTLAAGEAR